MPSKIGDFLEKNHNPLSEIFLIEFNCKVEKQALKCSKDWDYQVFL